jgi:hypothetical protein
MSIKNSTTCCACFRKAPIKVNPRRHRGVEKQNDGDDTLKRKRKDAFRHHASLPCRVLAGTNFIESHTSRWKSRLYFCNLVNFSVLTCGIYVIYGTWTTTANGTPSISVMMAADYTLLVFIAGSIPIWAFVRTYGYVLYTSAAHVHEKRTLTPSTLRKRYDPSFNWLSRVFVGLFLLNIIAFVVTIVLRVSDYPTAHDYFAGLTMTSAIIMESFIYFRRCLEYSLFSNKLVTNEPQFEMAYGYSKRTGWYILFANGFLIFTMVVYFLVFVIVNFTFLPYAEYFTGIAIAEYLLFLTFFFMPVFHYCDCHLTTRAAKRLYKQLQKEKDEEEEDDEEEIELAE